MRYFRLLFLFLFMPFACTAVNPSVRPAAPAPKLESVRDMMDSTVFVEVAIKQTPLTEETDPDRKVTRIKEGEQELTGWSGSGVVYDKRITVNGMESLILTAEHVLDVPAVGSVQTNHFEFLGMDFSETYRIDSVDISIKTNDGRVCSMTPLKHGVIDYRDVATGLAFCNAGRVAPLAEHAPEQGDSVIVVGYPEGFEKPIATIGYLGGITSDGYQAVSAGAWGGNSGGPAFVNGEVVGLLVRGSREYHHIGLLVPLSEVWARVEQTPWP